MRLTLRFAATLGFLFSLPAMGTVFATVHGVVHDPQHRPIAAALVTLQAADSAFAVHATSDSSGEFNLPEAPIGVYSLEVAATGFATIKQPLNIASGTYPIVHIQLSVAS